MTSIETLYKNYEILADCKEDIEKHADQYISIINAAAGGIAEKRLASQFIPQFSKYFPHLRNDALNVHLDLCEDADPIIRRQAIKALPGFCHDSPDVVKEITGLLTQMLFSDDPIEYDLVQISLVNLFKDYPEDVIKGLFNKMLNVEPIVRTRAMKFVSNCLIKHLMSLKDKSNVISVIVEETLEIFKSPKLDKDQTELCVTILNTTPLLKDNQQRISAVIDEKLQSITKISFDDIDKNNCLITILEAGKSFGNDCSSYVPLIKTAFNDIFQYMTSKNNIENNESVLKLLRKIVGACKIMKMEYIENLLTPFYDNLMNFLPLPPKEYSIENMDSIFDEYNINWNYFEPILISFHTLYCKLPSFMGWNQKDNESLKLFREKLQFVVRIMQFQISKKNDATSQPTDTNRPRIQAPIEFKKPVAIAAKPDPVLKGSKNVIHNVIKIFFHNPPCISTSYTPSWSAEMNASVSAHSEVYNPIGHKKITGPTAVGKTKTKPSVELYIHPGIRTAPTSRIPPPVNEKKIVRGRTRFNRF